MMAGLSSGGSLPKEGASFRSGVIDTGALEQWQVDRLEELAGQLPQSHVGAVRRITADNLGVGGPEAVTYRNGTIVFNKDSPFYTSTARHEVGHAVYFANERSLSGTWRPYYERAVKAGSFPGPQASRNVDEFFADVYRAYLMGPKTLRLKFPDEYKSMAQIFEE